MMKKRLLILCLAIVLVLGIITTSVAENVYKIGAIFPLTGSGAKFGEDDRMGVILAMEDINSVGGIKGHKIDFIFEDSKTDPKEAIAIFNKFLATSPSPVILATMSSVGMALKPLVEEHKIVMFIIAANPALTEEGGYVFRMLPTASNQTERLAKLASTKLKLKRVAVLHINDDFGDGMRKSFVSSFENLKGKISIVESFEKDSSNFRPQVTKVIAKKPEAVFVAGYGKALGIIIKQIREMGYKGLLLGSLELSYPDILSIAGEATEGAIVVDVIVDKESPKLKEFTERFQQRFKKEPNLDAYLAYDMVQLVAEAIKNTGYTADGIRESLLTIKSFHGLTGDLNIMPNGDVYFNLGLKIIKGGKAIPHENR